MFLYFVSFVFPLIIKTIINTNATELKGKYAEEIIDSAMTINGFKKLISEANLSISNQRFITIRPSHEIRYNVKSFRSPFGNIPLIREFLVSGTCYLLKKD